MRMQRLALTHRRATYERMPWIGECTMNNHATFTTGCGKNNKLADRFDLDPLWIPCAKELKFSPLDVWIQS